jgi:hypothetical protein
MGYTRRRQTKQKQFRETGNMGYTMFSGLLFFCLSSSCVPQVSSFSGLFLFCLFSSCVPYVASFSGLFLFCLSFSCVPHVASFGNMGYTRRRQTNQKQSRETGNIG